MRLSMWLRFPGLVLLCMSIGRLGAQQPHDGADIQKATVGKIAWQYDTGRLSVFHPHGRGGCSADRIMRGYLLCFR